MQTTQPTASENLLGYFLVVFLFIATEVAFAQPTAWQSSGIGGGGALFSPSINPQNDNEYFMACDMSQLFHTNDFGADYNQVSFVELFGGQGQKYTPPTFVNPTC